MLLFPTYIQSHLKKLILLVPLLILTGCTELQQIQESLAPSKRASAETLQRIERGRQAKADQEAAQRAQDEKAHEQYLAFRQAEIELYKKNKPVMSAEVLCSMQGEMFSLAASYRDKGVPPETANAILSGYQTGGITSKQISQAVNLVYFDPGFANAGGTALRSQVANFCLKEEPRYKPLE